MAWFYSDSLLEPGLKLLKAFGDPLDRFDARYPGFRRDCFCEKLPLLWMELRELGFFKTLLWLGFLQLLWRRRVWHSLRRLRGVGCGGRGRGCVPCWPLFSRLVAGVCGGGRPSPGHLMSLHDIADSLCVSSSPSVDRRGGIHSQWINERPMRVGLSEGVVP